MKEVEIRVGLPDDLKKLLLLNALPIDAQLFEGRRTQITRSDEGIFVAVQFKGDDAKACRKTFGVEPEEGFPCLEVHFELATGNVLLARNCVAGIDI